jgi:hypothetical protein
VFDEARKAMLLLDDDSGRAAAEHLSAWLAAHP